MPRISELANIRSGLQVNAADYQTVGVQYFRPTDVTEESQLLQREAVFVSRDKVDERNLLKKGEILLTKVGSRIGALAIFTGEGLAAASQNFLVLTPIAISSEDLKKLLLENQVSIRALATGAALPHISIQSISNLEISERLARD